MELANSAHWLTGGADGLQGIDIGKLLGMFEFDLWGRTAYTYSLVVLFLIFLVARRLTHSPFGLALRGIRENSRAHAGDRRAERSRISARSTPCPRPSPALPERCSRRPPPPCRWSSIDFQRSADVLVMLVLGGAGMLYGGLIGAVIFMVARDQFSGINPQYWYFWIGLLLVAVVMLLPNGILGGLSRSLSRDDGAAQHMTTPALSTRNLNKSFGQLQVARDI